jgi:acyl-CoA thioester hydrolase
LAIQPSLSKTSFQWRLCFRTEEVELSVDLSKLLTLDDSWEFETRWGEMDANGHINNVNYLRYFEEARARLFRKGPWTVGLRKQLNLGPVLHRTEVDYLLPLAYPVQIRCLTQMSPYSAARIIVDQEIQFKESGKVACRVKNWIVFMDLKTNRPIALAKAAKLFLAADEVTSKKSN